MPGTRLWQITRSGFGGSSVTLVSWGQEEGSDVCCSWAQKAQAFGLQSRMIREEIAFKENNV